jgi:hypothetical protein
MITVMKINCDNINIAELLLIIDSYHDDNKLIENYSHLALSHHLMTDEISTFYSFVVRCVVSMFVEVKGNKFMCSARQFITRIVAINPRWQRVA